MDNKKSDLSQEHALKIEEFKEKANRPDAWDSDVEKLLTACNWDVKQAVSLILDNDDTGVNK